MKGRGLLGILAATLLSSCGLETVSVLSTPAVGDPLSTEPRMSFVHDASRYNLQNFLGYEVYYRIYPEAVDATASLGRLLADRSSLSTSPTVDRLLSLGYQRFGVSSSATGSGSVEDLLIEPDDGNTIGLDFNDFLTVNESTSQPVVQVNGANTDKPYLYRTKALVGIAQAFDSLRSVSVSRQVDMAASITNDELTARKFEMNIFIAAFGVDSLLVEVRSSPVPWGVIRDIKPFN